MRETAMRGTAVKETDMRETAVKETDMGEFEMKETAVKEIDMKGAGMRDDLMFAAPPGVRAPLTVEPLPEWWRDAGGGAVDSGCAYAFPGHVDPERRAGGAPMVFSVEGGSYPAGRRTLCGVDPDGVLVELPRGAGVVQALQQAYCGMAGGVSKCRGAVVDVPLLVHLARGAAALGPAYVVSTLTDGAVRFTARGVSSTFWRERRADPLRVRFGCSDDEGRRVRLGPSAPPPAGLMDMGAYRLAVWAWTRARLRGFRG